MSAYCKAVLLVLNPAFAFWAWGTFQSWVSGHAAWMKNHPTPRPSKPLNKRFGGYGVADVAAYWATMIPHGGLDIERRYLKIDLLFPLVYGTTLACASMIAARSSRCLEDWALAFAIPPLIGMAADWTENLVQLKQLQRYTGALNNPNGTTQEAAAADALQSDSIAVASRATRIKLYSLGVSVLLLAGLLALMLCSASAARSV